MLNVLCNLKKRRYLCTHLGQGALPWQKLNKRELLYKNRTLILRLLARHPKLTELVGPHPVEGAFPHQYQAVRLSHCDLPHESVLFPNLSGQSLQVEVGRKQPVAEDQRVQLGALLQQRGFFRFCQVNSNFTEGYSGFVRQDSLDPSVIVSVGLVGGEAAPKERPEKVHDD